MAIFFRTRSFAKSIAVFDQNERWLWLNGTVSKLKIVLAFYAVISILAVILVQPADGQNVETDASATAPAASTANLVRWTGSLPQAAGRTVEVTFALYQEPEGGPALWSETQSVKVGADGRYSVLLGAMSTEGLSQTIFQSGEARWIEARPVTAPLGTASIGNLTIESDPTAPYMRSLLSVVPYAFKATDADTLAGRPANEYVTREEMQSTVAGQVQSPSGTKILLTNTIPPLPIVGTPLPILGASSPSSSSSQGGGTVLNGAGTSGFLPAWTASSTLGNSMIAESGTNVGIGTIAPATMLDVNGASTLRGTVSLLATAATLATGANSPALQMGASSYSSAINAAVPQTFVWQAQSSSNNTVNPSANLALLFGAGTSAPAATGLSIAPNGQINFANGQTFPGTGPGTITGITPGTGIAGGGSSGNVTLALSGPVSITNGGTGAATPAEALLNLGGISSQLTTPQILAGPLVAPAVNSVVNTSAYASGSSSGGLVEAYAACPNSGCNIQLSADVTISSTQTIAQTRGKPFRVDLAGHTITCRQTSGACLIIASTGNYAFPRFGVEITGSGGVITYAGSSANVSGLQIGTSSITQANIHVHDITINNFSTPGSIGLNAINSEDGEYDSISLGNNMLAVYLGPITNQNEFNSLWINGNANAWNCDLCAGNTLMDSVIQGNSGATTILVSGSSNRFKHNWFENNGDNTPASVVIVINVPATGSMTPGYVSGLEFDDNVFIKGASQSSSSYVYQKAGSGTLNSAIFSNNLYLRWPIPGQIETGFSGGNGISAINDRFPITDVGIGSGTHAALSFCPASSGDCWEEYVQNGALNFEDNTIGNNMLSLSPSVASFAQSIQTPSIQINGGTIITSQSSASSQLVTCQPGGTGTQVCDAAGNWVSISPTSSSLAVSTAIMNNSSEATILAGPFISSVKCATANCTNLRGTLMIKGGAASNGIIASLKWPATASAYVCTATQNGSATSFGIGNSVATPTGFNITAAANIVGETLMVNYSCQP